MRPVFLGVVAAVRYALDYDHEDDHYTFRLVGACAIEVGMNLRRSAKRDAARMAWMMRLKADNPGMFSTRRYVAEVLPMVTSEMHQRARTC